jgi:hypothetical protein
MRFCWIILLSISVFACSGDAGNLFSSNVVEPTAGEVKNLKAGKIDCLHCPMYFSFDATPPLVERIIVTHELKQLVSLTPAGKQVERLVRTKANWWQSATVPSKDQIYWVHYSARSPALESAFRLLVIKNGRAFFITSGHFSRENYVEDNA